MNNKEPKNNAWDKIQKQQDDLDQAIIKHRNETEMELFSMSKVTPPPSLRQRIRYMLKWIILTVVLIWFAILAVKANSAPKEEPTLEDISICFNTKSDMFQEAMKDCTETDFECMEVNFRKVCGF